MFSVSQRYIYILDYNRCLGNGVIAITMNYIYNVQSTSTSARTQQRRQYVWFIQSNNVVTISVRHSVTHQNCRFSAKIRTENPL